MAQRLLSNMLKTGADICPLRFYWDDVGIVPYDIAEDFLSVNSILQDSL